MTIANNEQQQMVARIAGISYFALLGLVNLVATFYYSTLRPVDFIVLFLCALPLLLKGRRLFLQACGFLGAFISLYMAFAAFGFNADPNNTTSQTDFNMGYLFIGSCLVASVSLIYAGLKPATVLPASA